MRGWLGWIAAGFLGGLSPLAAEGPAQLDHLGVEDGLAQGSVNAITRDANGFLWFGTEGGLDRWDGYTFQSHRSRPDDPFALPSNFVWSLHPGRRCLWVGTNGGGLACRDRETGRFATLRHDPLREDTLPSDSVLSVVEEADGTVWAGTEAGLARIDWNRNGPLAAARVQRISPPAGAPPGQRVARVLFRESAGTLWVGTDSGLLAVKPGARSLSGDAVESRLVGKVAVRGVHADTDTLLVGSFRDGLFRIDRRARTVTSFRVRPDDSAAIPSNTVITLQPDGRGGFWLGTELAVVRFDPVTGRFAPLLRSPKAGPSLRGDADVPVAQPVLSSFVEPDGTAWFGTWGDGALRFDPRRERFSRIVRDSRLPGGGLGPGRGRAIAEDADGALWLGLFGGGIQKASRTEAGLRFDSVSMTGLDSAHRNVWALRIGRDGTLWAATDGGLLALPKGSRQARELPFPARFLRLLAEAPEGDLWVGSDSGLYRYRPGVGVVEHLACDPARADRLRSEKVYALADRGTTQWIGTWGGLARRRLDRPGVDHFFHDPARPTASHSLPADIVWALHRDRQGRLWAGTNAGLVEVVSDGPRATFTRYGELEGLPDDVVYCIVEDPAGRLWLSTNRGLAAFDPRARRVLRTFDESDGLPASEFSFGACHAGNSGLTFGGVRGFVRFDHAAVLDLERRPPRVVLTGLLVQGRSIAVGKAPDRERALLTRPLEETDTLELTHEDSSFTLEFAALDFRAPGKNRYSFRLHGFDPDWSPRAARRSATYTNLDPGDYRFQVRAAGADGAWNERGASIHVRVLPPFWRTSWFRAGGVALLLGLALGFHRLRLRALVRRRRELELEVAERTADLSRSNLRLEDQAIELSRINEALRKADALKTEMLGIAAHDLKNPLAVVRGFAELLQLKVSDAEARDMAQRILRSSDTMLGIVTRLLDSAALESGQLAIARDRVDLRAVVASVLDANAPQAGRKRQELAATLGDGIVVTGDAERLAEVVDNLVGNAIKYAPGGSTIAVRLGTTGRDALLEVEDAGPGFAAAERDKLYRRFSRLASVPTGGESSSGLGLSIVKQLVELHGGTVDARSPGPGRGATFLVCLPLA